MKKKILISISVILVIIVMLIAGSVMYYKNNKVFRNMFGIATEKINNNDANNTAKRIWSGRDENGNQSLEGGFLCKDFLTYNFKEGEIVIRTTGGVGLDVANTPYGACLGHGDKSSSSSTNNVIQCITFKSDGSYTGLRVNSGISETEKTKIAYKMAYLINMIKQGDYDQGTDINGDFVAYNGRSKSALTYIVDKYLSHTGGGYTLYTKVNYSDAVASRISDADNYATNLYNYKNYKLSVNKTANKSVVTKNNKLYIPLTITNYGTINKVYYANKEVKYVNDLNDSSEKSFTSLGVCNKKNIYAVVSGVGSNTSIKLTFSSKFTVYTGRILLIGIVNGQNVAVFKSENSELTQTASVTIEETYNLKVQKVNDKNENLKVAGIEFVAGQGTTHTTNNSGLAGTWNALKYDTTYTITEVSTVNKYGYRGNMPGARGTIKVSKNGTIKTTGEIVSASISGDTVTVKFKNIPVLRDLEIQKVNGDTNEPLKDVSFKIKLTAKSSSIYQYLQIIYYDGTTNYAIEKVQSIDGKVKLIEKSGKVFTYSDNETTSIWINPNNYIGDSNSPISVNYTSEASATEFITSSDGKIEIKNLEQYVGVSNEYKYAIVEVSNPNNGFEYIDNTVVKENIWLDTQKVSVTIPNVPQYKIISGYVFEDKKVSGKEEKYDYVYDEKTDERLAGITVNLKHANGELINSTITNEEGEYLFEEVKYSWIKNGCYVEFEYNGLEYTSVVLNTDKLNGSKAQEVQKSRESFNNSFEVITNENSDVLRKLDTKVIATTENTNVLACIGKQQKIENINLGLIKREQTDISVGNKTDLQNVEISLNGYVHTYKYGLRTDNSGSDSDLNVDVNVQSKYSNEYTREMYESDISAYNADKDKNKLEVYMIYKIIMQNDTQTLAITPKEVLNYLDNRYELTDSWLEDLNGNRIKTIEWKTESEYKETIGKEGYTAYYTTSLKDIKMNSAGNSDDTIAIYLKVKVTDETVLNMINLKEDEKISIYNITEINSYTSYYTDKTFEAGGKVDSSWIGKVYGSVDIDSTPGTAIPGDITTYEDDTKSAPSISLKLAGARGLSGTVWEDENIKTNGERIGNGILDENEKRVQNVKVELLDAETKEIAQLYVKGQENKPAIAYTDEKGNYEFVGIIPGNYVTRFTYGIIEDEKEKIVSSINGKEVNVRDYKSTIMASEEINTAISNGDTNWYLIKGNRYSDATDDLTIRNSIEGSYYGTLKESYKMEANTEKFEIGVEYKTISSSKSSTNVNFDGQSREENYKFLAIQENMDFGIIERPKVNIVVDKKVSYIKVILQSGQVLLEGDPSQNVGINYTKTGLDGIVPMEIDTDLLQGSTLEITYAITVNNNSEIDYSYNLDGGDYYKYGKIKDGLKPINITITKLVDYLDDSVNCVVNEESNKDWNLISADKLIKYGEEEKVYISEDVYKVVKEGYIILETNVFSEIGRNSSKTVNLKVNKLLAATDEISIENYTEILELGGEVGRTINNATPGNYVPGAGIDEPDDDNIKVVIAPPTGTTELTFDNNIILITYSIIGMTIIAVGLMLIVVTKKSKKVK